ncbi:PQ-loop-domain-containing protein [Gigaspora margarita]|uniref:PQ-loop-domain-containing protein n=2 Tax=Gigaspora margarita TaxID=4874 RepID=A0A8H3XMJ5_GIGMA|nr:PQ-loop-domain-containing protein [Gigaspora margarita]
MTSVTSCDPLIRDGEPYIRWIHILFGACVYGKQEMTSILFGYLSIICWLNAQFPQLLKNYRNKSVDGLSLPFMVNWLLGDITNLLGCILTNQLPFQTYLATYFCIVDLALFYQYFYYKWFRYLYSSGDIPVNSGYTLRDSLRDSLGDSLELRPPPKRTNETHQRVSTMVFAILVFSFYSTSTITSSISTSHSTHLLERTVNAVNETDVDYIIPSKSFFEYHAEYIGRIFAWTCTVLYLTSRMPQIWKNYKRRSVEGLSIFMFAFAALGNLTYTTSIFSNPLANTNPTYLKESFPYVLGSIGTLIFDLTIFLQWYYWKDRDNFELIKEDVDSVGYSRLPLGDGGFRNSVDGNDEI